MSSRALRPIRRVTVTSSTTSCTPWLIGFFAFTLLPVLASLYFAFTDYDILTTPKVIGLANFQRMFTQDVRYLKSVKVTLEYMLVAVPLRLTFALILAMFLNTYHRGVAVYRAAYYAPSVIGGSVAVALMWRRIFGTEGLVNGITALFGFSPITWLGDPRTAIWTLIILAVWQFGSPMLIFFYALYLYQRAFATFQMGYASAMAEDFMAPLVYLGSPKLYTISLALRTFADPSGGTQLGEIFAMSALSLVPVFVLFISFQKYLVEGISTTGLKGVMKSYRQNQQPAVRIHQSQVGPADAHL